MQCSNKAYDKQKSKRVEKYCPHLCCHVYHNVSAVVRFGLLQVVEMSNLALYFAHCAMCPCMCWEYTKRGTHSPCIRREYTNSILEKPTKQIRG